MDFESRYIKYVVRCLFVVFFRRGEHESMSQKDQHIEVSELRG